MSRLLASCYPNIVYPIVRYDKEIYIKPTIKNQNIIVGDFSYIADDKFDVVEFTKDEYAEFEIAKYIIEIEAELAQRKRLA